MEAVFLGGSRRIARLNESMRAKIDELLTRGLWMVVGDANGADRALQQYLADRGYEKVVVYAVTGLLRNNVGHWKVRSVDAPKGARGFELYSVKDAEMAKEASYGLMLWDGKSRGTLANVFKLLAQGKPVAVHMGPARRFVSLKSAADLYKIGLAPNKELGAQHGLPFGAAQPDAPTYGRTPTYSEAAQPKRKRAVGARGRNC
ncbi:MAG: hypothetical protein A3I02_13325 [Betaproteobacteria bacterium RIFCSPLOWO2_02_FULL_67_26]|nr:MAG: hypothetical protein A3I02_13325 [Betaproteobacteria bacterium RIFCSPLOWO2_02_FULL_67_26]